jgi:hypothetical protein
MFTNPQLILFVSHGHCYLWNRPLVFLHVASDLLTAFAYYSIPLMLFFLIKRRDDVPFSGMFKLFCAFIFLCGTGHLFDVWTVWHPDYWLSGLEKGATALVSLYTVGELLILIPKALEFPKLSVIEAALQRSEALLSSSEARFERVAVSLPGVVYQYKQPPGPDYHLGAFTYISDGCRDLYGLTPQQILEDIGKAHAQIHPDDLEGFKNSINLQPVSGECWKHEWRLITPFGLKWVVATSRASVCEDGSCLWDGVILDITDRKLLETQQEQMLALERQARESAEQASRIKDEFLAILSHELRTPLTPIIGWVRLMRARELDEEESVYALDIIERNVTLQIKMIEDLLDVSRILQGKLSLNISPFNLDTVINAAVDTVSLAARAKSIHIETELLFPGQVLGDSGRLQQVVWNLLANSIKFTPRGGHVLVRLEPVGDFAQIQVIDTGQGISPDFLPYVFDRFRQENSSSTRKFGGLGLGLAIVQHLVELHGGEVSAYSAGQDMGATFTIRLPLFFGSTVDSSPKSLSQSSQKLEGLDILVVDDDKDTLSFLTFTLKRYGANVTAASSAAEALHLLSQLRPKVLLSDISMPDMDGIEMLRNAQALADYPIFALALTAHARADDEAKVLGSGFKKYLSKPIHPNVLVQSIASSFNLSSV